MYPRALGYVLERISYCYNDGNAINTTTAEMLNLIEYKKFMLLACWNEKCLVVEV